ncbi:N-acetylglucosamine kinase [Rhizobium sp. C4]|uniref:N-acetylglucosamine kinase n=1 Tax=Rhizobium sp. C4 TaxID=1349800 RepID=UPI001E4F54E6|nr:N-acetylglucosamine kinase [Rhizobium sp. C4]MCD2172356.1 N-acetylglucosamine kinase [Rhizobium sp. C4]
MPDYFIGIDGGGTSCRAAIADASGNILGRARGGAANILTNLDGALANITSTAGDAVRAAGLDLDLGEIPAFLGLAGANVAEQVHELAARLPFKAAQIDTDGLIALQGAFGNDDGVVAILGTGSVYITRHSGKVSYTGGWGFMLGDLGGGARIGRALLQECLLVHDGVRRNSPLIEATMKSFDNEPIRLVTFAHEASPSDFGRFAPSIFEAAGQGDVAGMALVKGAVGAVDEALDAAARESHCGICLLGGLSALYPNWIAKRHQERLIEPQKDALGGAVSLAISSFSKGAQ